MSNLSIYDDFSPATGMPVQQQITEFIRDLCRTGELSVNEKLPPIRQLAKQWDTNYFTVNLALKELVKENIIVRKPRLGTFVKQAGSRLNNIGIYMRADNVADDDDLFYMSLIGNIQKCLMKHNAQSLLFMDDRKDHCSPMPELQEAINKGNVDSLIAIKLDEHIAEWMEKLPVHCAYLSNLKRICPVRFARDDIAGNVLGRFRELGCRSLGIISNSVLHENSENIFPGLTSSLFSQAAEFGLECREEWFMGPEKDQGAGLSGLGYDLFHQFWKMKEKPDGVFIYPDIVAMGCIHAILELNINVPQDLKLIMHRNKGVNIHAPFKCDWLESSVTDIAEGLVGQLEDYFKGKKTAQNTSTMNLIKEI